MSIPLKVGNTTSLGSFASVAKIPATRRESNLVLYVYSMNL